MKKTKNNHYVPQFILKKFSNTDNQIYILSYSSVCPGGIVTCKSAKKTKNLFSVRNIYAQEVEDEYAKLESELSKVINIFFNRNEEKITKLQENYFYNLVILCLKTMYNRHKYVQFERDHHQFNIQNFINSKNLKVKLVQYKTDDLVLSDEFLRVYTFYVDTFCMPNNIIFSFCNVVLQPLSPNQLLIIYENELHPSIDARLKSAIGYNKLIMKSPNFVNMNSSKQTTNQYISTSESILNTVKDVLNFIHPN